MSACAGYVDASCWWAVTAGHFRLQLLVALSTWVQMMWCWRKRTLVKAIIWGWSRLLWLIGGVGSLHGRLTTSSSSGMVPDASSSVNAAGSRVGTRSAKYLHKPGVEWVTTLACFVPGIFAIPFIEHAVTEVLVFVANLSVPWLSVVQPAT